jgi:hypothetical protein
MEWDNGNIYVDEKKEVLSFGNIYVSIHALSVVEQYAFNSGSAVVGPPIPW